MALLGRAMPGFIWTRGPIAVGQSWTTFQGAAVLGITASMLASGVDVQPASAAPMSATVSLTATGTGIPQGAVAMGVTASLSTAAVPIRPAAASMSAAISMLTSGVVITPGAVTMSVAASMSTSARQVFFAAVTMSPAVSMLVSQATAAQGAAALAMTASLTAGAGQGAFATVLMTPSGLMTVAGVRTPEAAASLAVTGDVEVGASLLTTFVLAALSGTFGMATMGAGTSPASITLNPRFSMTTSQPRQTVQGMVVMTAASLLVIASTTPTSSVLMTPLASLLASASIQLPTSLRQSYYLRQRQSWAIEQEQQRHAQALYTVGEMACFVLMWHEIDFLRGLVQRCSTCYNSSDPLANRITNVYNQPTRNKCPDCFGTTFEGGFRARIVRPVIINDTDETEKQDRRGTVHTDDMQVESTWDFRSRDGDYLLRADGSRWRLGAPMRTTLRTGFVYPSQLSTAIAYSGMRASYEEEGSVAYTLPPVDRQQIQAVLTAPAFWPPDFSSFEIQRADLIPDSIQG